MMEVGELAGEVVWFPLNYSKLSLPVVIAANDTEAMGILEGSLVGGLLVLLILTMIVGNLFVILAILLERELQRPQYYLILSLAFADLMVGIVVSPLAAINEVHREWRLGVQLCDFWISMDVLACTSSILHLVAIALDRYWSITDVVYIQNRTPNKIVIMLTIVWLLSLIISVAPIFGWKDADFHKRVDYHRECLISQDVGYQLFSTTTAFFGPLILIIVVYWQIYKAARRRIRKSKDRKVSHAVISNMNTRLTNSGTTMLTCDATSSPNMRPPKLLLPLIDKITKNISSSPIKDDESYFESVDSPEDHVNNLADIKPDITTLNGTNECTAGKATEETRLCKEEEEITPNNNISKTVPPKKSSSMLRISRRKTSRETAESRRERKAWRTLAIITGTFVVCWLPFFMLAVVRPLCQCRPNPVMESVFLWLGYINCAINPVIYTIFSPDFRQAFRKILARMCWLKHRSNNTF